MDSILLTRNAISVAEAAASFPSQAECGSRIYFEGVIREEKEGQKVEGIFYEAYEEMAKRELEKIETEVKQKWPVRQMGIVHRLGEVRVGEISLIVVVETPHRKEGFEAMQYIIDQLKKRVPIWKKEFYETGKTKWL